MKKLYEIHAREKAGLSDEWCAYELECFPKSGREPALYIQVTGMIAPLKTTGKRKGDHNWSKGDKKTKAVVILPTAEHDEWVKQWEIITGICSKCVGEGKIVTGWNHLAGIRYKPCSKCGETGKLQCR